MSILRLAKNEPKRIAIGDEGDWIEVQADISKRVFNELITSMPAGTEAAAGEDKSLTIPEMMEFQQTLFRVFMTGWSLDADVSVDNYLALAREAGDLIDTALAEHFQSLTPSDKEAAKSA